MHFHVEISAGIRHARVFNLDREDVLAKVVSPWLEGRPIEMGDREWVPRESSLKILGGPQLDTPDLAFGQGWANAERSSEDITKSLLEEAPAPRGPQVYEVEVEAEADPAELAGELAGGGGEALPISLVEASERIDRRDPRIAAVILLTRRG